MKDKNLIMILNVIYNNGNVQKLIREGLNFKQITDITGKAIELEYIIYLQDKISLSQKGIDYLIRNKNDLKIKEKKEWIEKEKKSQIEKIGVNDIFLPSKKSLAFLKISPSV